MHLIVVFSIIILALVSASCKHQPEKHKKVTTEIKNKQPLGEFGQLPSAITKGQVYQELKRHTFSDTGRDVDPCLDSTGKLLYFASNNQSKGYNIFVKELNSRSITQLTLDEGDERFPRISPNGKLVAFSSNRNGNWDIFVMKPTTNSIWQNITNSNDEEIFPTWSSDGTKIAFCALHDTTWRLKIFDTENSQLSDLGEGFLPQFHPKDDILVFQRPRGRDKNLYGIWTIDILGNKLTEIVSSSHWAAINPCWSPDGNYIVFSTCNKSKTSSTEESTMEADDIWIQSIKNEMPIQMTTGNFPEWSPFWGEDGRIYFCANRDGVINIWSVKPIIPDYKK